MVYAVSAIAVSALAVLMRPFLFNRRFTAFHTWTARSKVNTAQWTPELLKQLEWRRFEELCAAYFQALGFRTDVVPAGAGGGVDINLIEQGADRASIVVQCQPWNAYRVGIKPVRGLLSAMTSANFPEGVLVTAGKFTKEARDFARQQKISLIDGTDLLAKIAALVPEQALGLLRFATEGDFNTPTCPTCAVKMIPRKSTTHGRKFWGCRNYPSCKQTFSNTL
jgi:restriction system protein